MNLQIYDNPEFGKVRVVEIDGEPWFVAADVCRVLEIKNARDMVARLDDDEKNTVVISDGNRGNPNTNVVNESGLYTLVVTSRKPEAKRFRKWITSEVIPAIRKHGAYLTPAAAEKILLNPDFVIKLAGQVKAAQSERDKFKALAEEHEETIRELKPQADYCKVILQSDEALPTRIIADDYGMSAQQFHKLLLKCDVVYRQGKTWLVRQKFRGNGYTCKITRHNREGQAFTYSYWTQKGRMFLYYELKKHGVLPVCERTDPQALF